MKDAAPQPVFLADYQPPAFLVDEVALTFHLDPQATRVISRIAFRPNPDRPGAAFALDGEHLTLQWARIDGAAVEPTVSATGLTCAVPDGAFVWECEVVIDPARNTALEGLYMSNGMYCTQCEAEGFRRITYYPDRPDVMAVFTVTIHSDLPVLLSNGNPVSPGVWHDPWPKPSYLFALVAGDLVAYRDQFTTLEGRDVALNIYVRDGDLPKCDFGMAALKAAMRWDEQVYRRAYDLDVFNIVAVDDFNMGAMENKGLNIFNSSCVLASPETATDANFERIEAIIAHEYFHNWTGNRITCRDWFQLCLKEGLTVFRDQQFTGDMRGHAVKRIDDAQVIRTAQFREDGGPLAHPVRPASFVEINNFYTVTVYDKGAELVGMLRRLVGEAGYARALDLYFDRHDGQAATIEDWLAAFADATGRDMTQFARWYAQAGTPRVTVTEEWDGAHLYLTLRQHTPPTPGQSDKPPLEIPVAVGLIAPDGTEAVPTRILTLREDEQTFVFPGLDARPVPSVLRDFSAPVILDYVQSPAALAHLLAHDTDPFNRWNAGRQLSMATLVALTTDGTAPARAYLDGLAAVIRDTTADPAFRARNLSLPTEDEIAAHLHAAGTTPDPDAIQTARTTLKLHIAQHMQDLLTRTYAEMQIEGPYTPDATDAGKRALGNAALIYLSQLDGGRQAAAQYAGADNMTQQMAALTALLDVGQGTDELAAFEVQWHEDRLVMDKWFGLQASLAGRDVAASVVTDLAARPDFTLKNPNRVRALLGSFARNAVAFHHPDGTGYDLLADWLIRLDPINPQTAARICTVYETWRRYDTGRQDKAQATLQRLAAAPDLSRDMTEMVSRMLQP